MIKFNKQLKATIYRLAIDAANDHAIITDSDGVVIYANQAVSDITGYSHKEVVGATPKLWGGQMPASYYVELWRIIKDEKKPYAGEVTNRRKNGTLYTAEVHIAPIVNKRGEATHFIGIERDITEKHESDLIKNEFITLASHQLRTPLSTLNWYSEILLGGDLGPLNKEQKQYVAELHGATDRMIGVVNDLLNVSRIELGKILIQPQVSKIGKLIDAVLNDNTIHIKKKKLKINTKGTNSDEKIKGDLQAINIILNNIISNAIKYTPKNGTVTISTEQVDGFVVIYVKDSGYGIPKKDQRKMFTKFFRAENVRSQVTEGTGLGLYIAKAFTDLLQGTLEFKSKEDEGTEFIIKLPILYNMHKPVQQKTEFKGQDDVS